MIAVHVRSYSIGQAIINRRHADTALGTTLLLFIRRVPEYKEYWVPEVITKANQEDSDGVRILVVEDNHSNQMVAVAYLKRLGYQADVAVNGQEALEKLSQHQYPVILMDCQMPVMDGFEATIELRRREGSERRTVVIALTANAMKRDREACERAGMDDFISKPMKMGTLNERLEHWFAKMA